MLFVSHLKMKTSNITLKLEYQQIPEKGLIMELQKALETRRSVRAYDADKKVTKEQVKELVEAAILAPSWKNSQTARYYCILDENTIQRFSSECLPEFNAKNTQNAAYIVTTFDRNGTPDNECGNGWGYYDLGLHNENLLLKATELGLSTLVMGIREADAIRSMFAIPEAETIVSVIAVGYGTSTPAMPKRKAAEDILKFY